MGEPVQDASLWFWVVAAAHGKGQIRVAEGIPACREETWRLLRVEQQQSIGVGGPFAQCHSVRCCVVVTPICVLRVEVTCIDGGCSYRRE